LLPACSTAFRRSPTAPTVEDQGDLPAPHRQLVKGNSDAFAHFAAGESYFDNEDAAGTLRQWEAAAMDDPSNEGLVIEVAGQLLRNKENDKALAVLSKSASRTNASATVLAWLARAQLQANHLKQALASSKLAIQRQPGALDGYECQVEVLLQTSNGPKRPGRSIAPPARFRPIRAFAGGGGPLQPLSQGAAQGQRGRNPGRRAAGPHRRPQVHQPRLWQRLAEDYARLNQQKKAAEIYTRLLAEHPEASTRATASWKSWQDFTSSPTIAPMP
jgi:tetratricopeptide (TPR) repeat protein